MFESTLYLLVRQKTCYYVAYKWMESNVYTVCIVTNMLCNMSFEMTSCGYVCTSSRYELYLSHEVQLFNNSVYNFYNVCFCT